MMINLYISLHVNKYLVNCPVAW